MSDNPFKISPTTSISDRPANPHWGRDDLPNIDAAIQKAAIDAAVRNAYDVIIRHETGQDLPVLD